MSNDALPPEADRSRPLRMSDEEYLVRIERLAQAVFDAAVDERPDTIFRPALNTTPLDRAIHDLVVQVRRVHHDGDGCVDH